MLRLVCYLTGFIILLSTAVARDMGGKYDSIPPEIQKWFRSQVSPKSGGLCCNEADGGEAQEDIRDGHYWVTWPAVAPLWVLVPDEVVLTGPNKAGHPVVWIYYDSTTVPKIRCYAPGAKL